MSKKTFLMYQSWGAAISKMDDAQAGQLLKAIYALQEDPDAEPEDPSVGFVFEIIKEKMNEDAEAYEETLKAKSEAGKAGMKKRWGKSVKDEITNITPVISVTDEITDDNKNNLSVSDTVSDSDTVSVTESDTGILHTENTKHPPYPPQRGRKFSPPSIEEVKAYCSEHNYAVDPEEFVDFYTSKGWKVGKNPMKDWKAAVRTWARRDKTDKQPNRFHNFEQRNNTGVGDMLRQKQIAAVMKGG